MNIGPKTYRLIRQIHLYSTLLTAAFLLMYLVSSFVFMNHDTFHVDVAEETKSSVKVNPEEINEKHWHSFLEKNHVKGRLTREQVTEDGNMERVYSSAGHNSRITIFNDKNEVEIVTRELNMSGKVTGLHRLRGYGGSLLYNIYAILLDVVGISLILFAVTGVILWLKLLQFNKFAWVILISGFVYVGAVIAYLMLA